MPDIVYNMKTSNPAPFFLPALIAEDLFSALADQIIFGDLEPGRRLTEEWVEEWAGVSRSPIREAFRRLEHEGLVTRAARRGVTVASVSIEDLDEVYQCRIVLEGMAAELAAKQGSPQQFEELKERLQEMARAAANADARDYFRASVGFSETIHAASGNRTMRRLLSGVEKRGMLYRFIGYEKSPTFMAKSVAGGAELLEALLIRDGKRAKQITQNLIQTAWSETKSHLERTEFAQAPADELSPRRQRRKVDKV